MWYINIAHKTLNVALIDFEMFSHSGSVAAGSFNFFPQSIILHVSIPFELDQRPSLKTWS